MGMTKSAVKAQIALHPSPKARSLRSIPERGFGIVAVRTHAGGGRAAAAVHQEISK